MDCENELKASRKLTLEWAKQNLQGKTMIELQTGKQILFTGKGIKEAINQPHIHYLKKNEYCGDSHFPSMSAKDLIQSGRTIVIVIIEQK